MSSNKISEEITSEVEAQIIQSLREMYDQHMPFLKVLDGDERRRLSKYSRKYAEFVDRSLEHAMSNPEFLPSFLPLEEFKKDIDLKNGLRRIRAELNLLDEKIKDTIILVSSEAYQNARLFYNTVKAAARAKEGDAVTIAKDLAYHFKGKKSDTNENEEEPEKESGTEQ
jgi:hypothetical protein